MSLGIHFKCGKATFVVAVFLSAEIDIFWRDRCVIFLCLNTWKSRVCLGSGIARCQERKVYIQCDSEVAAQLEEGSWML